MRVNELLTNEVIERFRLRKETPQERDTLVSLASVAKYPTLVGTVTLMR